MARLTVAASVAAALALAAGAVYQATSGDRRLADSYRAVLAQGHGSFFAAALTLAGVLAQANAFGSSPAGSGQNGTGGVTGPYAPGTSGGGTSGGGYPGGGY